MTEAEVKAVMKDRVEAISDPASNTQSYTPFRINSIKAGPVTGTAMLSFGAKTKTLQRVGLDFSRWDDAVLAKLSTDEIATRVVAYDYVSGQLLGKYGRPLNETGRCPTSDEVRTRYVRESLRILECTRLWRDEAQTVEMKFSLAGTSLALAVEYKSRAVNPLEL
jgi:hypothetical protein